MQSGFDVKLIDNLIAADYEQAILRETENALCLGISVLTGPHIGAAVRVASRIKSYLAGGIPAWQWSRRYVNPLSMPLCEARVN
jgi:hypothetical protein